MGRVPYPFRADSPSQSDYNQPLLPPTKKAIDPESKSILDSRIIEAISAFLGGKV